MTAMLNANLGKRQVAGSLHIRRRAHLVRSRFMFYVLGLADEVLTTNKCWPSFPRSQYPSSKEYTALISGPSRN